MTAKRARLWAEFRNKAYAVPLGAADFTSRANRCAIEDYTPVLLGHAQLYVFADRYDVPELRSMALQRLQRVLEHFTLYAERRGDIVRLLQFAYDNTAPISGGGACGSRGARSGSSSSGGKAGGGTKASAAAAGQQDELRELVVLYTACMLEDLMQCSEFARLRESCVDLGWDLVHQLVQRLD